MPTIPRTAIGVFFFLLGSLLCSVIGDADLCQTLRHLGTDILISTPGKTGSSGLMEQPTEH